MGKRRGQELGSDLLRVFQRTQKNVEAGYPPLTIKWPSPQGMRLERVRGKVDYDVLERVSTQTLLDMLEVPQRSRTQRAPIGAWRS